MVRVMLLVRVARIVMWLGGMIWLVQVFAFATGAQTSMFTAAAGCAVAGILMLAVALSRSYWSA